MVVTTHILEKKEKRTEEKKGRKKEEEQEQEKENTASYSTGELCEHARTQKTLPCERERIVYCHHTTTAYMLSRGIEEEIHREPYAMRTEQSVFDNASRKNEREREGEKYIYSFFLSLSSSLMLSLLLLIQMQTGCFLLHCDCTIECYYTVASYSFSYHHQ